MIIYNYIYDVENLRLVPIITYTIAAVTSHSLSNLFFFLSKETKYSSLQQYFIKRIYSKLQNHSFLLSLWSNIHHLYYTTQTSEDPLDNLSILSMYTLAFWFLPRIQ